MSPSRLDIVFHGRVQGVGFRARAASAAVRTGVHGWVRNEPDGTVRCVAEGESLSNSAFLESLLHDMSRYIESHEAIPDTFTGEFSSFEVRY